MIDKPKPDADIIREQRIGLRDKDGTIVDDPQQSTWLDVPLNLAGRDRRKTRDTGPTLFD